MRCLEQAHEANPGPWADHSRYVAQACYLIAQHCPNLDAEKAYLYGLLHDIGRYAFIGAGAVVTKTVPDYALVIGNPARQTGWMSEYGHRLIFDAEGVAVCPESGEKYRLQEGVVVKI